MDGAIKQYSENLIAKKILMNADASGYNNHTLAGILISRKDGTALTKEKYFQTTKQGNRKLHQTAIGWQFHVNWKDGMKQWTPLKVLKESNPVDVSKFVTSKVISNEPAFS